MNLKIYIPNASGYTDQHLHRVGLGAFCDHGADWEDVTSRGPDGGRGMTCQWKRANDAINAPPGIPDAFEWHASPPITLGDEKLPKGSYWIGFHPEHKPGPVELVRKTTFRGHPVMLCDGNKWQIPSSHAVPKRYGIDFETGSKQTTIDERFHKFCFTAMVHATAFYDREEQIRVMAKLYAGIPITDDEQTALATLATHDGQPITDISHVDPAKLRIAIPVDDAVDHCWEALSLNYRVNPAIVTLLGLLDDEAIVRICLAAIDANELMVALKKNGQESAITLPTM